MPQRNDMAEKVRLLIDGVELDGLVSVDEYPLEKGVIEVPEFSKIRVIQNGITKYVPLGAIYKIKRDSNTLKFLRDWFQKNEVHEIIKIRTDAGGIEFARTIFQACESVKYVEPKFDGAAPTYAQVVCSFVPYEVIPLDAA